MSIRLGTYDIDLFGRGPLKNRIIFVSALTALCILYGCFSDYNFATASGNLSMVLFLVANIYFPAKRIRLYFNLENVQPIFDRILVYHIWLCTASFVVGCIHCYITLWSNNWLLFSLFLMGWLTFAGFMMFVKFKPRHVKRGMYLLHTQQFIFFVLIFALLKGHYVF